jgi:hypothetical protein
MTSTPTAQSHGAALDARASIPVRAKWSFIAEYRSAEPHIPCERRAGAPDTFIIGDDIVVAAFTWRAK